MIKKFSIEQVLNEREYSTSENRPRGVQFDMDKHATNPGIKKAVDAYNAGIAGEQDGKNIMSTTSHGKDIDDSRIKSDIRDFDAAKAKLILESENIVKEYNAWIDADLERILSITDLQQTKGTVDYMISTMHYFAVGNYGVDEKDMKNYLKSTFYFQTEDPEAIKKLLRLRLEYSKNITETLQRMLKINYKMLGYTDQQLDEVDKLIKDLDTLENSSNAITIIKNKIYENRGRYIKNGGEIVDLTSLGFGKIFCTRGRNFMNMKNKDSYLKGNAIDNATSAMDRFLQKSMKYDAIVVSHGVTAPMSLYNLVAKNNNKYRSSIKYKHDIDQETGKKVEIRQDIDPDMLGATKMDIKGRKMDPSNPTEGYENTWIMEPIRTDKSGYFTEMNAFLRQLIKEGYKKILIAACNPGSHPIAKDIKNTPGVFIMYSDYSNLIENADMYDYDMDDDFQMSIYEGERELYDLCESCGLDYNSINPNPDMMSLLESKVTDTIKVYARKILEAIVGFFKWIWEFLKKVATRLLDFIKEKLGRGKKGDYVKAKIDGVNINVKVNIVENAKIEEFKIPNREELEKVIRKSCDSIQKEIARRQREQVNASQRMQQLAMRAKE